MELVKVEYEGHIFDPWECSGWCNDHNGWHVLIGKPDSGRNFLTKKCPLTPGGLADKINEARKLNNGKYNERL